jgi:hypothetical protein
MAAAKKTGREATDGTKKLIGEFHDRWGKAGVKDREEQAKLPKLHDPEKGEFIEEVDPKLADK